MSEDFGAQEFNDEDRTYAGSRFREVREAIFANPYQPVWGAPDAPQLPYRDTTLHHVIAHMLGVGKPHYLRRACERTLDSTADLRWGPDRKGFRRIVHANGVCLAGLWEINEETEYSGYFKKGSRALAIGRYSTSRVTERGKMRSLALACKLYPTDDPDHVAPLRPANFFVQGDLGGETTEYVNDFELRSAPDVSPLNQGAAFAASLVVAVTFHKIDAPETQRQIYRIAELGRAADETLRAPAFMRLVVDPAQPRIAGQGLDFRHEIMGQIYDRGDPSPKRELLFHIEVTERGELKTLPFKKIKGVFSDWRRIGALRFHEAVASYNGDCVIHFGHPPWRKNQNDPSSVVRKPQA